jgi:DtxR family Mn-dependent transcriptional regulator
VRAHRLAERWFTDRLGLDWASADEEAQRIAPDLSPRVVDRLDAHLGNPSTCPHGNVIPGRAAPYGQLVALADLEPGTPAVVQRISEVAEHDAPALLELLHDAGLMVGKRVHVAGSRDAGAISVRIGKQAIALGTEVAGAIWVEPVS